mgnify:CR=1 FL=1
MQTTTFEAQFPDTYPVDRLKNVKARFTVVVKRIMRKVEKEGGVGGEEDNRREVEALLLKKKNEER